MLCGKAFPVNCVYGGIQFTGIVVQFNGFLVLCLSERVYRRIKGTKISTGYENARKLCNYLALFAYYQRTDCFAMPVRKRLTTKTKKVGGKVLRYAGAETTGMRKTIVAGVYGEVRAWNDKEAY